MEEAVLTHRYILVVKRNLLRTWSVHLYIFTFHEHLLSCNLHLNYQRKYHFLKMFFLGLMYFTTNRHC